MRKSPYRHPVNGYQRGGGRYVNAYWRGEGIPLRKSRRVVGERKPFRQISSPVVADVVDWKVLRYDFDNKERVSRPVSFRVTLVTADDARGHEDEEWLKAFMPLFPAMDNSLREGYTIDNVIVSHDSYAWDKWHITLILKHGAPEIETKEMERSYVERLARATVTSPTTTFSPSPLEMLSEGEEGYEEEEPGG